MERPEESERERDVRPIAFIHIPKAAGTTLQEFIYGQRGGGRYYRFPGSRECVEEFGALSRAERAGFSVVSGHVHFEALRALLPGRWDFVTMLRDPVERAISHYYFVLASPRHWLHERVVREGCSLRRYVEERMAPAVDNGQVRLLALRDHAQAGPGGCTREMLDRAKENLSERFAAFGVAERFEDSLGLFRRTLGWRGTAGERRNRTEGRPRAGELDGGDLLRIAELNALDVELHAFALGLLEERLGAGRGRLAGSGAPVKLRRSGAKGA